VGGGGEAGHVQAYLGDDRAGQPGADAGDLRQPLHRGQGGGVRAGPGVWAGGPVRIHAPGGGHRRDRSGDPGAVEPRRRARAFVLVRGAAGHWL
jgi:hypothetical protein